MKKSHRGAITCAALLLALATLVAPTHQLSSTASASSPAADVPGVIAPTSAAARPRSGPRRAAGRPNIVFFLTDDMRSDDLDFMPRTRAAIGDRGMTFPNMISPHPLCCPARAELLTGQYGQNSGVQHNSGPRGGYKAFDAGQTTAVWLQKSGYHTAFHGKHLNGYEKRRSRDAGWNIWDPLVRGTYSYTKFGFHDGDSFGYKGADDYVTDRITERGIDSIRRFSGEGKKPFFVVLDQLAPHTATSESKRGPRFVPPPAAKQDAHKFSGEKSPSVQSPAFNEDDMSDKESAAMRRRGLRDVTDVHDDFRARIRSLQAVDRGISRTVRVLRRTGELKNTFLFFTSDNGYAMGEHRYVGKNWLFDEILSVPLLVRGPGIRAGSVNQDTVTTLDIPATFVDLSNASKVQRRGHDLDGRSLLDSLTGDQRQDEQTRDTVLIQTGSNKAGGASPYWAYRGVQTDRYRYAARPGDQDQAFLYDRARDPYELNNVVDDLAYRNVVDEMLRRTAALVDCAGSDCNRTFGPAPVPLY